VERVSCLKLFKSTGSLLLVQGKENGATFFGRCRAPLGGGRGSGPLTRASEEQHNVDDVEGEAVQLPEV